MAAIQLKEDVVLSWLSVIMKAARCVRRESDKVRRDGTFLDLRVMRCEPVENGLLRYHLSRGDRHVRDHLSHERTCRLVINGHARDATTLRGLPTPKLVGRGHDNRHTLVTELSDSGAGDEVIMSIAGHVSRAMLSRYSHVRMEAKRRALDEIAARQRAADEKRQYEAERQATVAVPSRPAVLQVASERNSNKIRGYCCYQAKFRCGIAGSADGVGTA